MKFLKHLDFLFESKTPYPYKLIRSERDVDVYEFISAFGMDYDVRMIRDDNILFVSFSVKDQPQNVITNKGDMYKVFSTVIEIIRDQFNKYPEINTIGYDPVSSFPGDDRREKIYEIGIKRTFTVLDITTKKSGKFVTKLIKIK